MKEIKWRKVVFLSVILLILLILIFVRYNTCGFNSVDSCLEARGVSKGDPRDCEKVYDLLHQSYCYYNAAVYNNDKTICDKISSETQLYTVPRELRDKLGTQINPLGIKESCNDYFNR